MRKLLLSPFFAVAFVAFLVLQSPSTASANVLGSVETFSVDPDLLGFVSVHSSATMKPGWINVGVFGYYSQDDFLTYQNIGHPEVNNYQRRYEFKDKMFTTEVFAAVGLLENLEFTMNMPIVLYQDYDHSQQAVVEVSKGIQSFRPGLKYNLWKTQTTGIAILASADIPVDDTDLYLGDRQNPIFNFEAAWDTHVGNSLFGINVGYRKRTPGNSVSNVAAPLHDQFTASAGLTAKIAPRWSVTGEIFGSLPVDKGNYPSSGDLQTLEVLGAVRFMPFQNLFLHAGASVDTIDAGLSPTYRVFAGINYMFDLFSSAYSHSPEAPAKDNAELDLDGKDKAVSKVTLSPQRATINTGGERTFTASGGRGYYRYEVVSGDGIIDADSGKFVAGTAGVNHIRATDADGSKGDAYITVKGAPSVDPTIGAAVRNDLIIVPSTAAVYEGSRTTFQAQGGTPPYRFAMQNGLGRVNSENGEYLAPSQESQDELVVTDSTGTVATSHIKVRAIPKATKSFVLSNLRFKFNSDKLVPSSNAALKKAVKNLKTLKIKSLIIEGHTDSIGKAEYNKALSIKRAEAIRLILIKDLKIDPSSVTAVGFGKERPLVSPEKTPTDRLRNRRVELKLYAE